MRIAWEVFQGVEDGFAILGVVAVAVALFDPARRRP